MAARALWKGSISFGLVNIPVELHVASRDHSPHFRLLHEKDLSPISLERVCQKDGKTVAWDDLVKGYEIEPGRFVVVTDDDFKSAAIERSRSIEILAFVPLTSIDARYWDTPYVATPAKGADHSYALLAKALQRSGRVGISKYVMREREHLAALVPIDDRLVVSTMRFPEDLVAMPAAPRKPVTAQELKLADQLVASLADEWRPSEYSDEYVKSLMKVIEAKAAGKTTRVKTARPAPATNVVDLVARLKQSLAAAQRQPAKKARRAGAANRKAARPARKASPKRSAA